MPEKTNLPRCRKVAVFRDPFLFQILSSRDGNFVSIHEHHHGPTERAVDIRRGFLHEFSEQVAGAAGVSDHTRKGGRIQINIMVTKSSLHRNSRVTRAHTDWKESLVLQSAADPQRANTLVMTVAEHVTVMTLHDRDLAHGNLRRASL